MSLLEPILKAALLGTEKYQPEAALLPHGLGEAIAATGTDREDIFLKTTAVALWYTDAGSLPQSTGTGVPHCPPEERTYTPTQRTQILTEIIQKNDLLLLEYFTGRAVAHQQVIPPQWVPALLDLAVQHKKLRPGLLSLAGTTGQWLCGINPYWLPLQATPTDEIWQTGTEPERLEYLKQVRAEQPARAIELLQDGFEQENAALRLAFLQVLHTHKCAQDEAFLQKTLADKSKPVKQEAQLLLKTLPGSDLNKAYLAYAVSLASVREERYLLVSRKKVLHIAEGIEPPKALTDTGISKVSGQKGVDDHYVWFAETVAYTPPEALAQALQTDADTLLQLMLAHKGLEYLRIHLVQSAINFRHAGWMRQLIAAGMHLNAAMLQVLPPQEQLELLNGLLQSQGAEAIAAIEYLNYLPCTLQQAGRYIEFLKNQPYHITKRDYQVLALHFPPGAAAMLEAFLANHGTSFNPPYFIERVQDMLQVVQYKQQFTA